MRPLSLFFSHTHMGLRSMKKVIESFWVTAGQNNVIYNSPRKDVRDD